MCRVIQGIFCEVRIKVCINDIWADIRATANGETPNSQSNNDVTSSLDMTGPTVAVQPKIAIIAIILSKLILRLFLVNSDF